MNDLERLKKQHAGGYVDGKGNCYYTNEQYQELLALGEVVVTTDETGACVAVTRQDEEGRILETIWKAPLRCKECGSLGSHWASCSKAEMRKR